MAAPFGQLKFCGGCSTLKTRDDFHRDRARRDGCQGRCKSCISARERKRYAANRDAVHEYNVRHYAANREERLESVRQYAAEFKAIVFAHYGEACVCCGSGHDLTLDHINGDGREWRHRVFGGDKVSNARVYRWFIINDFPDDIQTLCRRCNRSKGTGPRCRLDHSAKPLETAC